MLSVFKYPVEIGNKFEVQLPKGAEVLKVENEFNAPQLWALVDPDMPKETRSFHFAGTGHPIDTEAGKLKFINTFQMNGGAFIWHIFEILS